MYKISDFSNKSGVSIQTLRYYDKIDLFKPSYTDLFTGYRYYQKEQINKINLINKLKDIGLSLENIKRYLETSDINIIVNYKKELDEKMDKINKFINNDNKKKYVIIKEDYKKYIELNGIKNANNPQSLEVRDNNANYFVILENNELLDDFCIYNKDNWITLNDGYYSNKELIMYIMTCLKDEYGYDYITIIIPNENNDLNDRIKNMCKVQLVEDLKQGNWSYKKNKSNTLVYLIIMRINYEFKNEEVKKVYLTAKEMGKIVGNGKDLPTAIYSATKTDYIVKPRSIYSPALRKRELDGKIYLKITSL